MEQQYSSYVQEVYSLEAEAFLLMDPSQATVVREIEAQEYGGTLASKAPGIVPLAMASSAFVTVRLLAPRGDEIELYGPSHVASPSIADIGLVVLRVTETGFSVGQPGELSLARAIGGHVYVDQVGP